MQFKSSMVTRVTRTSHSPEMVSSPADSPETENIYEVIQSQERGRGTLHSCINIPSRRTKKYHQLDSSNECILTDEEESRTGTFNKIIFCLTCLCD